MYAKRVIAKVTAVILATAVALTLTACGDTISREVYGDNGQGSKTDAPSGGRDDSIPNTHPQEIEENPVSDFEYKAISGGVEITKYIGTSIKVRVPEKIEGVAVTSIGDRAFARTGIMEIVIPESVTYIGQYAFSGNEALTAPTTAVNERSKGSLIGFGGYFWRVLDVQGDEALIISEDILESRQYHTERTAITWEHSDIRRYLNGEFLDSFYETDKVRIVETMIEGVFGGNNTVDKVFLLSTDEVEHYFSSDLRAMERVAFDASGRQLGRWWLRSPGGIPILENDDPLKILESALFIESDGSFMGAHVEGTSGVRPALWLKLE